MIKDSGDRTEFESGAVRDMHEGKGRCDLMPLDAISIMFGNDTETAGIFKRLEQFKQTGDYTYLIIVFESFIRKFSLTFSGCLLEVAKHFEEGAKKYGENNWQKGIPVNCYIDSAVRHYLKYLRGDMDEPHDRAFVWNILCCMWTCINKPELNDYRKDDINE